MVSIAAGRPGGHLPPEGVPLVVETVDLLVERDLDRLVGAAAGEQPPQHRHLEDLEGVAGRRHRPARARHLRLPGDADERVHRADRGLAAEDLVDDQAADLERRAGRGVVDARGLEVHALVGPAHRPVDLPHELAARELAQQHRLGGPARARVGHLRGGVVVGGDRGVVAPAGAAVGLEREVLGAGDDVAVVLGVVVLLLRAEAPEDAVDPGALAHREQHLVAVGARRVLLGLADPAVGHAQLVERGDHRRLEVLGPVRVLAARRGRHRGERLADVLLPRGVDPGGDAAEAVVVVPRDQVLAVVAAAADLVGDEVRGHDLAQVAEVDRARGAQAGGADDPLVRMAPRGGLDHLVGHRRHPVRLRCPGRLHHLRAPLRSRGIDPVQGTGRPISPGRGWSGCRCPRR